MGESQSSAADFQILGETTSPIVPPATITDKGTIKLAGDFDPSSTADLPIIKTASPTVAGKAKIYTTTGANTDGGMTQKAVTDALARKVFSNTVPTSAHTSDITEFIQRVHTIPPNTFYDGFWEVFARWNKSMGTLNTAEFRMYLNTSPTNISTNILGHISGGTTIGMTSLTRKLSINGNSITVLSTAVVSASNEQNAAAQAVVHTGFDFTQTLYLIITSKAGDAAVSTTLLGEYLEKP